MDKQVKEKLFEAFLASAIAMGGRLKDLSWFGKNHASKAVEPAEKLAA